MLLTKVKFIIIIKIKILLKKKKKKRKEKKERRRVRVKQLFITLITPTLGPHGLGLNDDKLIQKMSKQ
jgi:hypothetical protein